VNPQAFGDPPVHADAKGFAHRLDARVKIALLFIATVAVFWVSSLAAMLACCAIGFIALALVRPSQSSLVRSLVPLLIGLGMILLAYSLRFDGSGDVACAGSFGFSSAGFLSGLLTVSRFFLLALIALVVGVTTTVEDLAGGLVKLLMPLRAVRVPVDDLATLLTLALRFIPICMEQVGRITDAQRARGASIGRGNLAKRVLSWVPVLIPLFVGVFRRCESLADAMTARCYQGERRTHLSSAPLGRSDIVTLAVGSALLVAFAVLL
jgi:energy-coupling factor transporter transmembrane protein EcfT